MLSNLKFVVALLMIAGRAASFSAPPSRLARIGIVGESFPSKPTSFATTRGKSTALEAIPNWALYPLGHIVGGMSNAPVVIRTTKTWYKRIPKPSWTPPNFVFSPVWTTLYGLMGLSVSRIAASGSTSTKLATQLWAFHYALNISWAPVFFGFRNFRLGLIINFFLIASLGYILPLFHSIDPLSAYLQIPYVIWLISATKLNQTICKLNPMLGGVNKAMILADLYASGDGDGYNDEMLQYDIKMLQNAAAEYAGV